MQSGLEISTNLCMADKVDFFTSIMKSLTTNITWSCSTADLTLLSPGSEGLIPLSVHSFVLASQSSFLSNLLLSASERVMVLPGVEVNTVKRMLQLLYTGRCPVSTQEDKIKLTSLLLNLGMEGVAKNLEREDSRSLPSGLIFTAKPVIVPGVIEDSLNQDGVGVSFSKKSVSEDERLMKHNYCCQMCGWKAKSAYKLRDHYTSKHFFAEVRCLVEDESRRICQFCGQEFEGGPNLIYHMVRHIGSTHKQVLPLVEKETKHSNITCDQCKICKKIINQDTTLGIHLVKKHFKSKLENLVKSKSYDYKCYICNVKAKGLKDLVNHVGISHGRAMKWYKEAIELDVTRKKKSKVCHICGVLIAGAGTNWRYPFYTHLARRHFVEELMRDYPSKNFKCSLCGVVHDSQSHYVAHLGSKHKLVEKYFNASDFENLEIEKSTEINKKNSIKGRTLIKEKDKDDNPSSSDNRKEYVPEPDIEERKSCCPYCNKKMSKNPVLQSHLFSRHFRIDCEEAIKQILAKTEGVCPLCPWIKWDNYSTPDWSEFFHFSRKHKIAEKLEYSDNAPNQSNVDIILVRFGFKV